MKLDLGQYEEAKQKVGAFINTNTDSVIIILKNKEDHRVLLTPATKTHDKTSFVTFLFKMFLWFTLDHGVLFFLNENYKDLRSWLLLETFSYISNF
jgi:hypothetical protein